MDFPIILTSQSQIPLHRQLYDEIRKAILSGRLTKGQKILSTRSLAAQLGISRATVSMAYEFLLSEGYIQSTSGSGTYVCTQLPDNLLKPEIKVSGKKITELNQFTSKTQLRRLSKYGAHLQEKNWLEYGEQEVEIQFSFGRPDLSEFPLRQWMQLSNEFIKKKDLFSLDCPSKAKGYLPLREAISSHLAKSRAVNCHPEQIIIVNGSQQGIDLVARTLIDRGDLVGIEDPGYIGAKYAFEVQGAQLLGLAVDPAGMVVENLLKEAKFSNMKLVYLTPSHQSPTGAVLSLPRRLELLAWAKNTNTFIIEDDYDSEYRYLGRPVPALAGLAKQESVIYVGTFSKVLFPALRLGYLVVPESLSEMFARAKFLTDRHSALLEQQVLAEFIKVGYFERHIRKMRNLYQSRRQFLINSLHKHFKERVSIFSANAAGINLLVQIHGITNNQTFISEAQKLGVGIVSTTQFYIERTPPPGEFLLNYASLSEEKIEEGIRRLSLIQIN